MLYLLPLCWVMAILNSTLFLGNPQFYQGESPPWRRSVWGGLGKGPLRLGSLPSSCPSAPVWGSAWDLSPAQRLPMGVWAERGSGHGREGSCVLTAPLQGSASCWAGGLGAGECPWLQPWSPPTSDEGAQGLHRAVSGHQTPPECPGACRAPACCRPPGPDPHAHQHGGEGRQGWGEWGGGCGATGAGCASAPLPTGSFGVPGLRAHPELPGGCPALLGSWLNPTACLEPHPSWGLAL